MEALRHHAHEQIGSTSRHRTVGGSCK